MTLLRKANGAVLLQTAVMVLAFSLVSKAQTLEAKLSQRVSFAPQSSSPLGQLLEVAQHYEIPMGIEWIDESEAGTKAPTLSKRDQQTVQDFINEILQGTQGYRAQKNAGVLNVARPRLAVSPKNFLNISIPEFQVRRATLFDAEALLRLKLEMFLHPERYAQGWNGGWGNAPGSVFDVQNATFSGHDLTVRQILNNIVAANGNALWIVHLTPSTTMATGRFFAQSPYTTGGEERFYWQFVPLRDVQGQK